MTPKSLLRHPDAKSKLEEFAEGTTFKRIIPDSSAASESPERVKKLLFCTGRVYYDLAKERTVRDLESDIAIARVEQVRDPCVQNMTTAQLAGCDSFCQ